ncbi:MAG: ankyrin repeat domain-containing protein [Vicinamibacterales bacterium]
MAPSLVQEFVQKAHADLPATTAMLAEQPSLLNATWDWGGGDFEAGIGGAGHMGNRDIAEFLIAQGARLDIFVAAMLGKLDIVQVMLTTWPALLESKGPHGISLLRHARAGGEPSRAVVDHLLSRGAK